MRVSQYTPLYVGNHHSAVVYGCEMGFQRSFPLAVVVVVLHLLRCCPCEDIWALLLQVRGAWVSHTATAIVHLEHRRGTQVLDMRNI